MQPIANSLAPICRTCLDYSEAERFRFFDFDLKPFDFEFLNLEFLNLGLFGFDRVCDTLRRDAVGFGLLAFARPGVVG